jgi:branched-chain amino acid transport system ATP-binding protein
VSAASASGPTALLEARSIVAGYLPGVDILNGCSVHVDVGELIGIIGPNGAGKSTLVKALFGLVPVRSGTVLLDGTDITGHAAHELVAEGVGYVPQNRNVFGTLTIAENLAMGSFLAPKELSQRTEQVAELFPILHTRANQRAGSLSGGERQLVAMARALMAGPRVLLLDEPSAGLSPVMQDEVFERIAEINRSGVSILMVEQNARRCLQLCHRAYVLDQGVDAHTGTGQELLHDPRVVELYLGTLARKA